MNTINPTPAIPFMAFIPLKIDESLFQASKWVSDLALAKGCLGFARISAESANR
ncbi:MAG TPA: hypothetical protein VKB68_02920 [Stellaceae bacterium]|nr:hypothetical protein [Stellaceae bacterium]